MSDAITVMEHTGMARQVATPPFPQPVDYGASSEEYDAWLDAVDRGEAVQPSPGLAAYLDARDQHLQANYDVQVIPRHKLWTNDGWLITPTNWEPPSPTPPAPRWTAASGPSPGGPSGSTTSTPPEATAASESTSHRHPSTPDGAKTPMHEDRVTVTDLIQELEACDPDAEVRLAQQPAWPFEYAIDPTNAVVEVELDGTPVVYLGEGAQLGYLPDVVRHQLSW
jgi:hypothetical protein